MFSLCFQLVNPILRTNSYVVLTELEERHVGFNLGHMPSYDDEF
jgi:hypothetical protein